MATTFSASLRPTRTRILLIALTAVLLLGCGLLTAQRARSATLTKKAYAVVDGGSGVLVRGSHALSATRVNTGIYVVTFDRHMDNCAIVASIGADGTLSVDGGPFAQLTAVLVGDSATSFANSTSKVVVATSNVSSFTGGKNAADSDFHVTALCPGT